MLLKGGSDPWGAPLSSSSGGQFLIPFHTRQIWIWLIHLGRSLEFEQLRFDYCIDQTDKSFLSEKVKCCNSKQKQINFDLFNLLSSTNLQHEGAQKAFLCKCYYFLTLIAFYFPCVCNHCSGIVSYDMVLQKLNFLFFYFFIFILFFYFFIFLLK